MSPCLIRRTWRLNRIRIHSYLSGIHCKFPSWPAIQEVATAVHRSGQIHPGLTDQPVAELCEKRYKKAVAPVFQGFEHLMHLSSKKKKKKKNPFTTRFKGEMNQRRHVPSLSCRAQGVSCLPPFVSEARSH